MTATNSGYRECTEMDILCIFRESIQLGIPEAGTGSAEQEYMNILFLDKGLPDIKLMIFVNKSNRKQEFNT